MKRFRKGYIIVAVALLLNSLCSKDFITRTPADSIDASQALTDEASLKAALNGVYSQLRTVALFGRDFPVLGDVQSDNTFVESKNAWQINPV